ncbi:putative adhesin [Tumebacillus sp. BK434]|uniref:DUF4097 family beta strand repeat-containing protein n=1 Tax=Tumebacillus sp. BK434 TaxID=2512169 RepID=UPI0010473309|nr:DUF4097 family beta strand repeat-containing protein [Tumebacillus sp. BK434]TCP58234.1 putative adhesin [Tumebacillus sp. BK434]
MKALKITAAVILGLLILSASISAYTWINRETRQYDEHKTFAGEKVGSVQVQTDSADLHLLPSNDDSVHIDFTGKVIQGGFGDHDYQLVAGLEGDVLKVELRREGKFQIGIYDARNVRFEVRLPEKLYAQLAVTAASADLQLAGLRAEQMTVQSSSGDIQAKDLKGQKMQFISSSGDQVLQNLSGELVLESASGDIGLRTWSGSQAVAKASSGNLSLLDMSGPVRAHASSGDIRLAMTALQEGLDLRTDSGDVRLALPDSAYFKLRFNTSSGSAAVDFPMTVKARDDHQLVAEIGDSGPEVRIATSSGDLSISTR